MIAFEWDERKAGANLRKHGVSFEDASAAFHDELALVFGDPDSEHEERFILLGRGLQQRLLVVVFCERGVSGDVLRIISARGATARERAYYRGMAS